MCLIVLAQMAARNAKRNEFQQEQVQNAQGFTHILFKSVVVRSAIQLKSGSPDCFRG